MFQPCSIGQATSIELHGTISYPHSHIYLLSLHTHTTHPELKGSDTITNYPSTRVNSDPAGKFGALLFGGHKPSTISWLQHTGNCSRSSAESSPKPCWLLFLHSCWDKRRHQSFHHCWWSDCNPRGSKQEHPKPREGWDLSPFIYTHSLSHALNHFAYWNVSMDNHCQNTTQNPPKSTTGSGNHDLPFYNINA